MWKLAAAISLALIGLVFLGTVNAQDGQVVSVDPGVGPAPKVVMMFYTGAITSPEYICTARNTQTSTNIAISSATAANPGVFTASADTGLYIDSTHILKPRITITGGTGNWTAANGTWVVNPTAATTFTIRNTSTGTELDTSSLGAVAGTLVASTTSPRFNQMHWVVRKSIFDGSNRIINVGTAYTSSGFARVPCSDRASTYLEWR